MTGFPLTELHANSKFSSLPLAASAARKAHKIETIGVVKPAINLIITGMAAVTAGFISPTGKYWVLGVGLFVTVCQALSPTSYHGESLSFGQV